MQKDEVKSVRRVYKAVQAIRLSRITSNWFGNPPHPDLGQHPIQLGNYTHKISSFPTYGNSALSLETTHAQRWDNPFSEINVLIQLAKIVQMLFKLISNSDMVFYFFFSISGFFNSEPKHNLFNNEGLLGKDLWSLCCEKLSPSQAPGWLLYRRVMNIYGVSCLLFPKV